MSIPHALGHSTCHWEKICIGNIIIIIYFARWTDGGEGREWWRKLNAEGQHLGRTRKREGLKKRDEGRTNWKKEWMKWKKVGRSRRRRKLREEREREIREERER